jgi:hypothetical protein
MRIDSALQIPPTHLNNLLIESHGGEEGQGHERVWSEILFVASGPRSSQSHVPFPSHPRRYVADRSLCKACILVCAAISQRYAVAVLGSVLYDVK